MSQPPVMQSAYGRFGLGRIPSVDVRDRAFRMRTVLPARFVEPTVPARKTWRLRKILDQGVHPRCVGYSWATMLRCDPYDKTPDPDALYLGAQDHDEWPGNAYAGSSVRGGAKFLASIDELIEYRWAEFLKDILDWIGLRGPVVVGTNWYTRMFDCDRKGMISVGGSKVGGHAYCLIGKNDGRELVTIANSWGRDWGAVAWHQLWQTGRGYMRYEDLDRLVFREGGEACAAVKSGRA